MAVKTTQRSLALLRSQGYLPTVVEHYNPYARRKFDLYGFADIVAIRKDLPGVLAVQTTTNEHVRDRIRKAEGLGSYHLWLACGNRVQFHGWRKLKGKWSPTIIEFPCMDIFS